MRESAWHRPCDALQSNVCSLGGGADCAARRRVRGVFVGIDQYESADINELRYAERDARALHGLFSDTLGSGIELLVGKDATRAAVEEIFAHLRDADPDDFVVIGFSGHGSETHELVTYDADVGDLSQGPAFRSTC